ncbi:TetR/AcrR family transcriptional regulator [Streptomyces griseoviridis]|jgi:AcrR family transcriptional regulator|nr:MULTISPECIES: TetR/AcrR family transcriptional regulator [Streptomyces]MDP9685428.1 AcrR family transcriptional regulator [Streptomyces griseoviridis]GGS87330.1 TetR family transcriptional regulator [Streptomyces griseoviridis]GGU30612.1 TetR family transcriptional regulator [Streptomyces daghestanicus]GHI32996.1 TetR family transcriptional regulator [Streptomyces daghestanicus]
MATPRGPRGQYTAGRARRTQILEAALLRFGRDGYRKTSLARVARDAEITDAGLLHHFRDKQQLLLSVVEYWHERMDVRWERVSDSVRDAFRCHLEDTAETLAMPGMVELAVTLTVEAVAPDHPAHGHFSTWQEKGLRELTDRLRAGSASGELRAGLDHEGIARECVAVDLGLQQQWLAGGRSFDLVAVMRGHLDRLMRSISADGRGL